MSRERSRAADPRRLVLRRRLVALAVLGLVVAALVVVVTGAGDPGPGGGSATPAYVSVELGPRTVVRRPVDQLRRRQAVLVALSRVPSVRTVHRETGSFELRVERPEATRAVERAVRQGGGTVKIKERPIAARMRVPLVKQALRDNCETAALSMALAFRGKPVGQLTLQSQVAHSPPLDPTVAADGSEVWGDPSRGFVGRADGGGPAGGFGVYQGPIEALARRHGVQMRDLTGSSPEDVYEALLHGHPVMIWVALSNGPYATWSTTSGGTIRVNYGEHALVLTGVDREDVRVNDPLSGSRLTWTKSQFEQMWTALGRRALAV